MLLPQKRFSEIFLLPKFNQLTGNGILREIFSERNGTKYSRMGQVNFVKDSLKKITWSIFEYFVPNQPQYPYFDFSNF